MAQSYNKVHSLLSVVKIREAELLRCLAQQNLLGICDLLSLILAKVGQNQPDCNDSLAKGILNTHFYNI